MGERGGAFLLLLLRLFALTLILTRAVFFLPEKATPIGPSLPLPFSFPPPNLFLVPLPRFVCLGVCVLVSGRGGGAQFQVFRGVFVFGKYYVAQKELFEMDTYFLFLRGTKVLTLFKFDE